MVILKYALRSMSIHSRIHTPRGRLPPARHSAHYSPNEHAFAMGTGRIMNRTRTNAAAIFLFWLLTLAQAAQAQPYDSTVRQKLYTLSQPGTAVYYCENYLYMTTQGPRYALLITVPGDCAGTRHYNYAHKLICVVDGKQYELSCEFLHNNFYCQSCDNPKCMLEYIAGKREKSIYVNMDGREFGPFLEEPQRVDGDYGGPFALIVRTGTMRNPRWGVLTMDGRMYGSYVGKPDVINWSNRGFVAVVGLKNDGWNVNLMHGGSRGGYNCKPIVVESENSWYYVGQRSNGQEIVSDSGTVLGPYLGIEEERFNWDGSGGVFRAQRKTGWYLIVPVDSTRTSREYGPFESISAPVAAQGRVGAIVPVFKDNEWKALVPDGTLTALDSAMRPYIVTIDSLRKYYYIMTRSRRSLGPYGKVWSQFVQPFASSSDSPAYRPVMRRSGNHWSLVVSDTTASKLQIIRDGYQYGPFDAVDSIYMNADTSRWVYMVRIGKSGHGSRGYLLADDGRKYGPFDSVLAPPMFSGNGRWQAIVSSDNRTLILSDIEGMSHEFQNGGTLYRGPRSSQWLYCSQDTLAGAWSVESSGGAKIGVFSERPDVYLDTITDKWCCIGRGADGWRVYLHAGDRYLGSFPEKPTAELNPVLGGFAVTAATDSGIYLFMGQDLGYGPFLRCERSSPTLWSVDVGHRDSMGRFQIESGRYVGGDGRSYQACRAGWPFVTSGGRIFCSIAGRSDLWGPYDAVGDLHALKDGTSITLPIGDAGRWYAMRGTGRWSRWAFEAKSADGWYVVLDDGTHTARFDSIAAFTFSRDDSDYVYACKRSAGHGDLWWIVSRSESMKHGPFPGVESIYLSDHGRAWAAVVKGGGDTSFVVFSDGSRKGPYHAVDTVAFDTAGNHWIIVAQALEWTPGGHPAHHESVVEMSDGSTAAHYHVSSVAMSSAGEHWSYVEQNDDGESRIVFDNNDRSRWYNAIVAPTFAGDRRSWMYIAMTGTARWPEAVGFIFSGGSEYTGYLPAARDGRPTDYGLNGELAAEYHLPLPPRDSSTWILRVRVSDGWHVLYKRNEGLVDYGRFGDWPSIQFSSSSKEIRSDHFIVKDDKKTIMLTMDGEEISSGFIRLRNSEPRKVVQCFSRVDGWYFQFPNGRTYGPFDSPYYWQIIDQVGRFRGLVASNGGNGYILPENGGIIGPFERPSYLYATTAYSGDSSRSITVFAEHRSPKSEVYVAISGDSTVHGPFEQACPTFPGEDTGWVLPYCSADGKWWVVCSDCGAEAIGPFGAIDVRGSGRPNEPAVWPAPAPYKWETNVSAGSGWYKIFGNGMRCGPFSDVDRCRYDTSGNLWLFAYRTDTSANRRPQWYVRFSRGDSIGPFPTHPTIDDNNGNGGWRIIWASYGAWSGYQDVWFSLDNTGRRIGADRRDILDSLGRSGITRNWIEQIGNRWYMHCGAENVAGPYDTLLVGYRSGSSDHAMVVTRRPDGKQCLVADCVEGRPHDSVIVFAANRAWDTVVTVNRDNGMWTIDGGAGRVLGPFDSVKNITWWIRWTGTRMVFIVFQENRWWLQFVNMYGDTIMGPYLSLPESPYFSTVVGANNAFRSDDFYDAEAYYEYSVEKDDGYYIVKNGLEYGPNAVSVSSVETPEGTMDYWLSIEGRDIYMNSRRRK